MPSAGRTTPLRLVPLPETNSGDLIAAVRAGDVEVFERLYRLHYDGLVSYIAGYVGSGMVAEELYQDIFLAIWRMRKTWEPAGSVKSYLYRAARNKAIDYLRHRKVEARWAAEVRARDRELHAGPDAEVLYDELARVVELAIDELPERRRLIFTMSREHDLTYREIAEALDISIKTVETQMGRALAAMRSALAPYLPFPR